MEQTASRQENAVGRLPWQTARPPKTAESGQTLLEFALMLPFMMLLLLGIAEIGRAIFITIKVNNAATAGASWGAQNAANAAQTGATCSPDPCMTIPKAAICDANGSLFLYTCAPGILTAPNTVATTGCLCDNGSGVSCSPMPASGTCTPTFTCGTGQEVQCVQVTTHADFDSLFHYPGLPQTFQANGKAVMRVRN